jgi:hypothetical protein
MGRACDAASPREDKEEALEQPLTWSDPESEANRGTE